MHQWEGHSWDWFPLEFIFPLEYLPFFIQIPSFNLSHPLLSQATDERFKAISYLGKAFWNGKVLKNWEGLYWKEKGKLCSRGKVFFPSIGLSLYCVLTAEGPKPRKRGQWDLSSFCHQVRRWGTEALELIRSVLADSLFRSSYFLEISDEGFQDSNSVCILWSLGEQEWCFSTF